MKQFHSTKNKLFINEELDIINLNYPSLNPQSSQKFQPEPIKSIAHSTNEIEKSNENKNEEQRLISEVSNIILKPRIIIFFSLVGIIIK